MPTKLLSALVDRLVDRIADRIADRVIVKLDQVEITEAGLAALGAHEATERARLAGLDAHEAVERAVRRPDPSAHLGAVELA